MWKQHTFGVGARPQAAVQPGKPGQKPIHTAEFNTFLLKIIISPLLT